MWECKRNLQLHSFTRYCIWKIHQNWKFQQRRWENCHVIYAQLRMLRYFIKRLLVMHDTSWWYFVASSSDDSKVILLFAHVVKVPILEIQYIMSLTKFSSLMTCNFSRLVIRGLRCSQYGWVIDTWMLAGKLYKRGEYWVDLSVHAISDKGDIIKLRADSVPMQYITKPMVCSRYQRTEVVIVGTRVEIVVGIYKSSRSSLKL